MSAMRSTCSPGGLLARALALAIAFAIVHALGWRDETSFLSGTPASAPRGAIYALVYFAVVLVAPALVLGAGVLAGLERLAAARRKEAADA